MQVQLALFVSLISAIVCDPQSHYSIFLNHPPSGYSQYSAVGNGVPFGQFGDSNEYLQPYSTTVPPDPSNPGCGAPPTSCPETKYRSIDGSCNHHTNPGWGMPNTTYVRLLPQNYGDGISTPTTARSGKPLPSSRLVSLLIYPDIPLEDPKWTLVAMQYGQIITHDMSMIAGSTQATPHATKCCSDDGQLLPLANVPEHCFPIIIPDDDPVHSQNNVKCMSFVRTITDRDRNCISQYQPAEQLTSVTNYLDLSIVYGSTVEQNRQLREYQGGRLRADRRYGKEWLPRAANASASCSIKTVSEPCYLAGDTRVNQNTQLTLLHTVLFREHNRVANKLAQLNPHWDDETLFEEARRIVVAEHQWISYNEWLPIFIGDDNAKKNKIIYETDDYVNDFQETVNPSILNEHATAAYRYFHSLIAGYLDLVTEKRNSYSNLRLSDWLNRPGILEEGDNFDELSRGLATQPQLAPDEYHDSEITQFLFRDGQQFGQDLKAIDIQRNRDHGLASYNDYRAFCGLPKAYKFEDFADVISLENIKKLAAVYEHPDDVELTVGGSLEKLVEDTLTGPTFLCILTEQFYRTRVGDRYWFENKEYGFTLDQLNEVRKSTISRLLCDNSHHVRAMQPRGFRRITEKNAVTSCDQLESVDLTKWKDYSAGGDYGTGVGYDAAVPDNFDFSHDFFYKK